MCQVGLLGEPENERKISLGRCEGTESKKGSERIRGNVSK